MLLRDCDIIKFVNSMVHVEDYMGRYFRQLVQMPGDSIQNPLDIYSKHSVCPFCKNERLSFCVSTSYGTIFCYLCHFSGGIVEFSAKYNKTTEKEAARAIIREILKEFSDGNE